MAGGLEEGELPPAELLEGAVTDRSSEPSPAKPGPRGGAPHGRGGWADPGVPGGGAPSQPVRGWGEGKGEAGEDAETLETLDPAPRRARQRGRRRERGPPGPADGAGAPGDQGDQGDGGEHAPREEGELVEGEGGGEGAGSEGEREGEHGARRERNAPAPKEPYEVPTSGTFWMHDDRQGDEEEEPCAAPQGIGSQTYNL